MANTPAPALELRDGDADELDQLLRSTTTSAGLARRARIVVLAADGMANTRISEAVGTSVPTVLKWRSRYLQDGLDGLLDAERTGRPRYLNHADVVSATLMPPPRKYGVTHWSSRLLAGHLGIGRVRWFV
ncbi:helix-turn-helix domain-containing protein [Gordonia humi]|uniref:Transposase n=1 Tax=Gordonia humi TaxID=686429 RepID=A0A840ETW1_9ACTN|nr:helix-turn-helix domain-containing protein [Gordonia humi]MBB4133639.1 transposase [Gordonia humi]MBB4136365.1 transposase [Gordonia humi]